MCVIPQLTREGYGAMDFRGNWFYQCCISEIAFSLLCPQCPIRKHDTRDRDKPGMVFFSNA